MALCSAQSLMIVFIKFYWLTALNADAFFPSHRPALEWRCCSCDHNSHRRIRLSPRTNKKNQKKYVSSLEVKVKVMHYSNIPLFLAKLIFLLHKLFVRLISNRCSFKPTNCLYFDLICFSSGLSLMQFCFREQTNQFTIATQWLIEFEVRVTARIAIRIHLKSFMLCQYVVRVMQNHGKSPY